jgi:hypothetical protein
MRNLELMVQIHANWEENEKSEVDDPDSYDLGKNKTRVWLGKTIMNIGLLRFGFFIRL